MGALGWRDAEVTFMRSEAPVVAFLACTVPQVETFSLIASELARCQRLRSVLLSVAAYLPPLAAAEAASGLPVLALVKRRFLPGSYFGAPAWKRLLLEAATSLAVPRAFAALRPRALVVGQDAGGLEHAAIRYARLRRVPVLLIQDAIHTRRIAVWGTGPRRRDRPLAQRARRALAAFGLELGSLSPLPYGHSGFDRIAVSGPAEKRLLVESGLAEDRVVITGQPRFDALLQSPAREAARQALGLPVTGRMLLLATQPFSEHRLVTPQVHHAGVLALLRQLLPLPGKDFLLIKPHPAETALDYEKLLAEAGGGEQAFLRSGADISLALAACEAILSVHSTVALEALVMGRQVVLAAALAVPLWAAQDNPYVQAGVGRIAMTLEEVRPRVLEALAAADAPLTEAELRFLRDQCGPLDGGSAGRLAALIAEEVRDRSRNLDPAG
jgi:hypothetical protein